MVALFLLSLIFLSTLATETTFYGIRVAKSCKSMLKDSLKLGENIHNEINHIEIGEISETQGDWWNHRTLTLNNVKASDFSQDVTKFSLEMCHMLPTGLLQAFANGNGFVWKISFEWDFKLLSLHVSGKGTAEVTSERVEFVQNYLDGMPDTNMFIGWNITKQDLGDIALPMVRDWLKTMLMEKLTPKLTLKINMHTGAINTGIIKPYEEIITKHSKGVVKVQNTLSDATEAIYKSKSYAVVDYKADILIPDKKYSRIVKKAVTTPVDDINGSDFDYQICYNNMIFGEYLDSLMKVEYFVLNLTDLLNERATVGYYKGIWPDLGNRYADDEKVNIRCHHHDNKEISYHAMKRFLLPLQCEFTIVRTQEQFLSMSTIYDVAYSISVNGNSVEANLENIKVQVIETIPKIDFQGKFVALEIAGTLAGLINGTKIPETGGFAVGTVRSDKYEFKTVVQRANDICLEYVDTEQ